MSEEDDTLSENEHPAGRQAAADLPGHDQIVADLVARLHWAIGRRRHEPVDPSETQRDAVPGDELVELVGRITLSASERVRSVCRAQVWPQVRAAVGLRSPGPLARGTYSACLKTTETLLSTPQAVDLAARVPASILAFPVRETEAPPGTQTVRKDSCLALLQMRLNAAWFLAGLEELWPIEGEAAARCLWHEGQLGDWDLYLRDYLDVLSPLAPDLCAMAADLAVGFDSPWCGVLRDVLVAGPMPEELCRGADADSGDGVIEATVLLRGLLCDELGDEASAVVLRCIVLSQGLLIEAEAPTGGAVAVWLPDSACAVLEPGAGGDMPFDLVVRGAVLALDDGDDESNMAASTEAAVRLLQLDGVARASNRAVPMSAFEGGHAEGVTALREALGVDGMVGE